MPLRALNDVITPVQLMTALAGVMLPNTRVQAAGGSISVDNATALNQQSAIWPSVVLDEGKQSAARISYRTWQTKLELLATYYDRWDEQPYSLDTIWAKVDLDLRRMKANVEDNPALIVASTRYCESLVHCALSPYEGHALSKTDSPFPIPVVMRQATILVNCLPYLSAT